ncbi:Nup93/Nic96-domain-containing protein [Phyllosticta citricarpa]|uniref:Nup93/Nic96-domain-containing protein n=2 Tax=Phyllosticta TaxID=121621 RepID=A0ABR1MSG1_9PEZI
MSFFGGIGNNKPLFGLGASSQAGGASATPAPQTNSLFGGLGQQSTAPGATGLSAPSSINPLQQTATAQPAGQQPNTQQPGHAPQPSGPLGQSQAPGGQTAYFDHLLERSRKRAAQDNGMSSTFGDLPSLQLGLGDIARKVRNLGQGGPSAPVPQDSRAHYLLAASGVNTTAALRDLNQFSATAGVGAAPPPPSSADVDIEAYISGLHSRSTLAMISEGLEQSKRDFDNFLEDNIQLEWDSQRKKIYEHFGLGRQLENQDANASGPRESVARGAFGRSRRKGRGLGASTSLAGGAFGASAMNRSVIGNPATANGRTNGFGESRAGVASPAPENRFMRDKQEKYATKVKELNVRRLEETRYTVLAQFAEVEKQSGTDNSGRLEDAYQALIEIIGEKTVYETPPEVPVRERQFAAEYLDENSSSAGSIAIRKRILDGSRRFLEKKFLAEVKENNIKNPVESRVGGQPTDISQVRGHIRLLSARRELAADNVELQALGEDHCWALIFYLLRAGLVQDAVQYVQENERAIRSMDRNFPSYLIAYARSDDRRLPPELQARISAEYQQRTRIAPENSLDPYRMACYKVVGRCELSRTSLEGIGKGMEDWAWLQFSLAREINRTEEQASETFTLDNIRATVSDITQRHFQGPDASSQYGVCFLLHILAGTFEEGVNFLYRHTYTAAVHFAIALSFYGLLRVSDFSTAGNEILTFSTRQKPQINFCYMVGYYTRDFRDAKPDIAAEYLVLLHLNSDLDGPLGRSQAGCCHEALRELVLQTRDFAGLLGDLRPDGNRIPGAIQERLRLIGLTEQEEFLKNITLQAATVADETGRITDAVLLYYLAEDHDAVITIINRALSDAIAVDLHTRPARIEPLRPREVAADGTQYSLSLAAIDNPVDLASKIMNLYRGNAPMYARVAPRNREALASLLQIAQAKPLVESGRWAEALDAIHATGLLPTGAKGDVAAIRHQAQSFNGITPVVSRVVGNLLMWTVTCCAERRAQLLNRGFEAQAGRMVIEQLEALARDLLVFAGLVRYKLPPRVFEALARAGQDVGA